MLNLLGALFVLVVALRPAAELVHEDYACDQWMPTPEPVVAGPVGRCGPWVRDGFVSMQVNVDKWGCNIPGDAANEPSIAIDPTGRRRMVIGWRQFDNVESNFRQPGWAYSHDAGESWVFAGAIDPGVFGSDPVLAADAEGRFFYLTINLQKTRVFRSLDHGLSWPSHAQLLSGLVDKPWITVDRTEDIGRGNIYVAGWGTYFFRSVDRGENFSYIDVLAGSIPTMDLSRDGTLYLIGSNSLVTFQISADARNAKAPPTLSQPILLDFMATGFGIAPNGSGLGGQAWVAVNPVNEDVYVLASALAAGGDDCDVMFTRSEDGGKTWSELLRISDDAPGENIYHWFGMMSVAPNGRIDAVWNDTRIGAPEARWNELYYSYSADRGVTWSPNIAVSPVFDAWIGYPNDPKLGDYYHMLSDNLGVNVAYAATFNGEQDIYFLRIGPHDCNANEMPDEEDIAAGTSEDSNANDVPDECEYRVDVDGDRLTTLYDHAQFLTCLTGPQDTTLTLPSPLARERGDVETTLTLPRRVAGDLPSPLARERGDIETALTPPRRVAGDLSSPLARERGEPGAGGVTGATLPGVPGLSSISWAADPSLSCTLMDPNHDGTINLADFAFLQRAFAP